MKNKSVETPSPKTSLCILHIQSFVKRLHTLQGHKVFVLYGTLPFIKAYNLHYNDKASCLIVNRRLLGGEKKYFKLLNIIYRSINLNGKNFDYLFKLYYNNFCILLEKDRKIRELAYDVYRNTKSIKNQKIIFIDGGLQGTFCLFSMASIKYFAYKNKKDAPQCDMYLFSVFPWIRNIFRNRYFSNHNEVVLEIEKLSEKLRI